MTLLIAAWLLIGFLSWGYHFIEMRKHPCVRPGFFLLLLFLVASPIFIAQSLFDDNK